MTTLVSELYAALKAAGVDDETARAAAKSVIAIEDKEQLATKADVAELRLATKADVAELRLATKADMAELRLATKADVGELRLAMKADLAVLEAQLTRTLITTMLAMTALFAAISTALRFVK